MLRGRDARAADRGCGMAWVGGHRGPRTPWCRGMMEGEGWRGPGSRGARWVMLRDETPRGFIEQRRRREERRRGNWQNRGRMLLRKREARMLTLL